MQEQKLPHRQLWSPSRRTARTIIAPVAAFFAAALIVLTIWFLVDSDEDRQFQMDAQGVAEQVVARLESTISTRLALGGLIEHKLRTGEIIDERDFSRFTSSIHKLFPDFQAISWVNEKGVIRWVTPLEGNEAAVNLDLRKLKLPGEALARAEQLGKTQLTPPIELAQGGRGFVAYIPIGTNIEKRGFLNIVFRIEPLVEPLFAFNADHRFHISVWDDDRPIVSDAHGPIAGPHHVERKFSVGGRTWTVALSLSKDDISARATTLDEVLLIAGLALSLAVGLLIRTAGLRQTAQDDSEAALKDFAEIASDWFWEMDEHLRFSKFSGHILNVFGEGAKYYLGKTRREISSDRLDDPNWQRHLADLDAHRPIENFAYNIDVPGKQPLHIMISGRPVYDDNGKFVGYRGTGTDISKQREAERALVLAKEQAESASFAKSEFLAHMSHELRSPLNSIIGFSQIWSDQTFGPVGNAKYLEYANDINNASTHLLAIISDILDISKIEAGEAELDPTEIDPTTVVQECVAMLEATASSKQVNVTADKVDDVPIILADERALKQILINILSNAIKFTPSQGSISITYGLSSDGMLAISITDTGIGIGKRDLDKVLEPFGQSRAGAHISHEGTGLGLPLAKRLTELHGGTLNIDSEEGKGTTVKIEFPVAAEKTGKPG